MREEIDKNQKFFMKAQVELLEHQKRLAVMEQAELDRQEKDLHDKEEIVLNSGKKQHWFQVPKLTTKKRRK